MSKEAPRILAVDPGTRFMGIAVLQEPEVLYYGVKTFWTKRPADELIRSTRDALRRLIADYRPSVLAYEKTFYVQGKSSALLQVQEAEIKRIGRAENLRLVGYSPARVRRLLCDDGRATKQRVSDVLARRFPELAGYRERSTRHQETYWLHMFDALAVAVVCAESAASDVSDPARAA